MFVVSAAYWQTPLVPDVASFEDGAVGLGTCGVESFNEDEFLRDV